ncbi:MAG: hypothetical protein CL607_24675 [Anaerolineaceae bacterium]|nr:hypothetical protein [Anaerolineaceae bacterium]
MRAGLFVIAIVVLSGCSVFEWLGQSGDMQQATGIQEANSAANADVTFVRAVQNGDTWTFHVTVAHPDTGWEDYADGWDVVLPDGTVIKPDAESPFTRLLLHPHENEQPFTRSQSGIIIPESITQVTVRAHDLVDGFGGQEIVVDFTQDISDFYEVVRGNS